MRRQLQFSNVLITTRGAFHTGGLHWRAEAPGEVTAAAGSQHGCRNVLGLRWLLFDGENMNTCQVGENTLRPGTAAHLKSVASELARAISYPPSWLRGHTKFHKEACTKTPRKKEGKALRKTSILLSPNETKLQQSCHV